MSVRSKVKRWLGMHPLPHFIVHGSYCCLFSSEYKPVTLERLRKDKREMQK